MILLAALQTRKEAEAALRRVATELGLTYDVVTDSYTYGDEHNGYNHIVVARNTGDKENPFGWFKASSSEALKLAQAGQTD